MVIITNQSGIGRKYYTEKEFHEFNDYFLAKLEENNIFIKEVLFCPHKPGELCNCRKTNTGMLIEYLRRNKIDPLNSYVIGDKTSDIKFGENLGLKTILLKTGVSGKDRKYNSKPTFISKNLFEAAEIIKNEKFE